MLEFFLRIKYQQIIYTLANGNFLYQFQKIFRTKNEMLSYRFHEKKHMRC